MQKRGGKRERIRCMPNSHSPNGGPSHVTSERGSWPDEPFAGFMPCFQARVSPPATFEWLHLPFSLLTAGSALILPTGRRWISAPGPVWHCCWNKRLEPLSCFIHFKLALSTTNYNSWHCTASWQGLKINTAPWLSLRKMHSQIKVAKPAMPSSSHWITAEIPHDRITLQ